MTTIQMSRKPSINPFDQFIRVPEETIKIIARYCVIYTRVSTKEQAENNLSLEIQLKNCNAFVKYRHLESLGHFGGTYESAKNDERKEFNRMLAFVKKSKKKVSYIIVYSLDRFSRSGANAIHIASELKKQGIQILSVTQPVDTNTSSGSLQQNIQFIFSQYDNDIRREKCMAGTKERLLKGLWVGQAPIGYDQYSKGKEQFIRVNEHGRILRNAFVWKAEQNMPSVEILKKLRTMGLNLNQQRLSDIFRNPFYCGMIVHKSLEGKLVEGKHEKLVSQQLFLRANQVVISKQHKWKHGTEDANISLRNFTKCDLCGKSFTGYLTKKKGLYYYKCGKIGCKCNRSAKAMNQEFAALLCQYNITEEMKPIIKDLTIEMVRDINTSSFEEILERRLRETIEKQELLQEKFILGGIDKDIFEKFDQRYQSEKALIHSELEQASVDLSNLVKKGKKVVKLSMNAPAIWTLSDYEGRKALQYLIFPEGLRYNTREKAFRTGRVNPIFT